MDYTKYTTALTDLLQQTLIDKCFIETGALHDSVEFRFNQTTYTIELDLGALEYLRYLDNGDLIDNFFADPEVDNLVQRIMTIF